jgi:hypothetical protein
MLFENPFYSVHPRLPGPLEIEFVVNTTMTEVLSFFHMNEFFISPPFSPPVI